MNDFHKLRENFQKFLNEGPNDLIPGYPNASYDKINDAHEGLKKALLDVSRASLASAAYSFGFSPEDVDARDVDDVGVMDQNWDRYLSADLDQIWKAGFPEIGIRKTYRDKKFWGDSKLGGENGLLYYFHHNADSLINSLETRLVLAEKKLEGEDLNDEKTKKKYKGIMLKIEAFKKAIEVAKNYKATLDATGGKPYSEFGKYDVAF